MTGGNSRNQGYDYSGAPAPAGLPCRPATYIIEVAAGGVYTGFTRCRIIRHPCQTTPGGPEGNYGA